jgi:uncharacterized membrane protein
MPAERFDFRNAEGQKLAADKVLEGLKGEGGTVLRTSLDHEALKAALAGAQAAVPAAIATT